MSGMIRRFSPTRDLSMHPIKKDDIIRTIVEIFLLYERIKGLLAINYLISFIDLLFPWGSACYSEILIVINLVIFSSVLIIIRFAILITDKLWIMIRRGIELARMPFNLYSTIFLLFILLLYFYRENE